MFHSDKKIIFLIISLLVSFKAMSQFAIEADIRPHAEYRYGYKKLPGINDKAAGNIVQRTRLQLSFKKDQISTRISFQDVRFWGQQAQRTHMASVDLHEAWIELSLPKSWALKAGRQELRYDNQRFIGVADWNTSGQKHDVLLLKHKYVKSELHIGAGFNQNTDQIFGTNYSVSNYKTLNFIWFKTLLNPSWNVSLLGLADGFQKNGQPNALYLRGTISAYSTYQFDSFKITANPALQTGTTTEGQAIKAYYFLGEVHKKINRKWETSIGFELISGNNPPQSPEKQHVFDLLYGSAHGFNGHMDYFTNIKNDTKGAGLLNPYFKMNFQVQPNFNIYSDIHLFYLNNKAFHNGLSVEPFLGSEFDLGLQYRFDAITHINVGYSMMFGTNSMEQIKGGNKDLFAHWAFLTLRVRPKFL